MHVSADKIIASLHNLHDTKAAAFTTLLNLVNKVHTHLHCTCMYS